MAISYATSPQQHGNRFPETQHIVSLVDYLASADVTLPDGCEAWIEEPGQIHIKSHANERRIIGFIPLSYGMAWCKIAEGQRQGYWVGPKKSIDVFTGWSEMELLMGRKIDALFEPA